MYCNVNDKLFRSFLHLLSIYVYVGVYVAMPGKQCKRV